MINVIFNYLQPNKVRQILKQRALNFFISSFGYSMIGSSLFIYTYYGRLRPSFIQHFLTRNPGTFDPIRLIVLLLLVFAVPIFGILGGLLVIHNLSFKTVLKTSLFYILGFTGGIILAIVYVIPYFIKFVVVFVGFAIVAGVITSISKLDLSSPVVLLTGFVGAVAYYILLTRFVVNMHIGGLVLLFFVATSFGGALMSSIYVGRRVIKN